MAAIFKKAPTKSAKFQCSPISIKIDIQEYFEVRNWLVMMKLASTCPNSDIWGSFGDFCVCIQTQSNLVITSPRLLSGDVLLFFVSFSLFFLFLFLFFHTFLSARFFGDALIKLYETLQEYHMPCEVVLVRVDFFKMAAVAMETAKNAKKLKNTKKIIAGYSPNRN